MGTPAAAATKCVVRVGSPVVGLDEQHEQRLAVRIGRQCGQESELAGRLCLRRGTVVAPAHFDGFVRRRRRRLSLTQWSRCRSATSCRAVHNSGDCDSNLRCFRGEAGRNDGGSAETLERAHNMREVCSGAENENASTSALDSGKGNFRVGRRMLLGGFAAGLSVIYSLSSSEVRAGADQGRKFSLQKGSWFLGDSETEQAPPAPEQTMSRVYDATALGEPVAIGSEKDRVWKRLLENRVIYLGEAESVADSDDKLLELEIVQTLRDKCFEQKRGVSLAFEAFPCPLQPQLNAYMNKKLSDAELRTFASHLPDEHWFEYLPILQYCKSHGVRLVACGAPLEVLRTVQAKGVQALSKKDRQMYIPPAGGGYKFKSSPLDESQFQDFLPNASGPFGPGPYRFAQARIVEDYTMSQVVAQIISDGGAVGVLLVITGASHVKYGPRGMGLPAWIAKNKEMQKRTQSVILLNPERQYLRKEGDAPEGDFLWYSAAKVCTRNCFDRAEVARVMGAAGRRPDALPRDLQVGLKQGLVAPEVLENFFELEQNPVLAELTDRFQGLRERWLADPRFLQRLGIEEAVSVTTTLLAQYERRGKAFWQELDYVATDTIRGAVVDFFTVWLPAPRLSFREVDPEQSFNALVSFKGLLGSFPDNAFQRAQAGQNWGIAERVGGIIVSGLKLFAVGFVSSVGTVAGTNFVLKARKVLSPAVAQAPQNKRSPILKTALVYSSFLGTSANLRYQIIAGVIEHWVADYWLASQPLAGSVLSFVARVANSYFGTGQWVDLARFAGLQAHGDEAASAPSISTLEEAPSILKTPELVSTTTSSLTEDIGGNSSRQSGGGSDLAP